jgi:peptidoglycan/LPS O-acetylase OafA/YrhL
MTEYPTQQRVVSDPSQKELPWVNAIKGAALLWIVCSHFVESTLGCPFIGNPEAQWPPFTARIAQLLPLHGHGLWDIPLNLVRYFGWLGDQGVGLFLIVSGFGLAWGLLYRTGFRPVNLCGFYSRRALRIYPLWWATHLFFIAAWVLIGKGLAPGSIETWLSFLGVRCTPGLFYYFSPAWWYIGLLIQLYLVFPLIWRTLIRWGAIRMFGAVCLIGFASREIGFLFGWGDFIDMWSRGAFFIVRLPEFCFGIALASWFFSNGPGIERKIRSGGFIAAAIVVYLFANGLSLTWTGMVVAPALLGTAGFFLFYNLFVSIKSRGYISWSFQWLGKHSYSIFLIHHPFVKFLVNDKIHGAGHLALAIAAAIVLTVILSLLLEKVTRLATSGCMHHFYKNSSE